MKKRLQHRCFLVKFRTALSTEYLRWLLLIYSFMISFKFETILHGSRRLFKYYLPFVNNIKRPITKSEYMGQSIQKNGPIKICGRQPLKNLKEYGLLTLQIFQRLCSTNFTWSILLNTLSHMSDGKTIIPGLAKNNWIIDN